MPAREQASGAESSLCAPCASPSPGRPQEGRARPQHPQSLCLTNAPGWTLVAEATQKVPFQHAAKATPQSRARAIPRGASPAQPLSTATLPSARDKHGSVLHDHRGF